MEIWIDGDACPREVRGVIYKAALRTKTFVNYIANKVHNIPKLNILRMIVVEGSLDAADSYIVANLSEGDLVITSDILFADEALKKKAYVINTRGDEFHSHNIGEKIATRNLLSELRDQGVVSSYTHSFNKRDLQMFAQGFDRLLNKALRSKK